MPKILAMPAGAPAQNPVVISSNTINYNHSAALFTGTESMYFIGPNQPYIYDIDFTDVSSITIVTKGGYGYGAWLELIIGSYPSLTKQYTGSAYETLTFDVSAITGVQPVKLNYTSSGNRCDISSMVLN